MATIAELTVRVKGDISDLQRSFSAADNQIGQFSSGVTGMVGRVKAQFDDMARRAGIAGTNMSAAITAPPVAIGKQSPGPAIDYRGAMNRVRAVTGATAAEIAAPDKKAIEPGAHRGLPATSAWDLPVINRTATWAAAWNGAMDSMERAAEEYSRRANQAFTSVSGPPLPGSSGSPPGSPPPGGEFDPDRGSLPFNPNQGVRGGSYGPTTVIQINGTQVYGVPAEVHDWLVDIGVHKRIRNRGEDF